MKRIRYTFLSPLTKFVQLEASGGIVLIITAIVALLWANFSPESYEHLSHWHMPLVGPLTFSLHYFVNDILMSVFFLVAGHEIKREVVEGELSNLKRAALPAFGALGGMVIPALIYAAFNWHVPETSSGWGIPMATDIAFAMGVITLLGARVPSSLKVFLLALAIVDDLGAVLVIALFYTAHLNVPALFASLGLFVAIWVLAKNKMLNRFLFFAIGALAWFALSRSGVHATVGGVVLGLLAPMGKNSVLPEMEQMHRWIAFFIMPLFALLNAGVVLGEAHFGSVAEGAVFWGVLGGLLLGKPLGILVATFAAVQLKWATLPSQLSWLWLAGAGALGGIGFTMALFISSLSLPVGDLHALAKLGILSASLLSALLGLVILWFASRPVKV